MAMQLLGPLSPFPLHSLLSPLSALLTLFGANRAGMVWMCVLLPPLLTCGCASVGQDLETSAFGPQSMQEGSLCRKTSQGREHAQARYVFEGWIPRRPERKVYQSGRAQAQFPNCHDCVGTVRRYPATLTKEIETLSRAFSLYRLGY